jgi:hypothetical protein
MRTYKNYNHCIFDVNVQATWMKVISYSADVSVSPYSHMQGSTF